MELKYRLLEHPFYQKWTMGEITLEQLSQYHRSYSEFIDMIPTYWEKAVLGLGASLNDALEVINDEKEHISLWNEWNGKLNENIEYPPMKNLLNMFDNFNPSELLGALHSFEIQQPEVAETKMQGLMKHYHYDISELNYFEEHKNEAKHIKFGTTLADKFANRTDFERGFNAGSKVVYDSLDMFL